MKLTIISGIILALIVLEIFMSIYLIYENSKPKNTNVCIVGKGCSSVQNSTYGTIGGIKLQYISIFAFIALLAMFFISQRLFLAGTIFGGLFSLYLITIQLFVLNQICSNCMMVDVTMIAITVLSIINIR